MAGDWGAYCAICASRDYCGDLFVHGNTTADSSATLESLRLCTPCLAMVTESLHEAVDRSPDHQRLDLPDRLTDMKADGACDVCFAATDPRFSVNVVRGEGEPVPTPLRRLARNGAEYVLCQHCLSWFRDVVDQESATRWGNRRAVDEPTDLPHGVVYRIVPVGLDEHDVATLREAVAPLGHLMVEEPGDGYAEVVYVLAATPADGAARFVTGLQAVDRVRTIVVTGAADLDDAMEALRLGAGDLLVTPLTKQQVVGMLDRLADPLGVSGRDERTGLPEYYVRPRFGMSCHLLEVTPPAGTEPLETFMVLRRFLRGYDRIGVSSDGKVPVLVYCSDEHIEGVVRRMRPLLGPGCGLELRDRASSAAHEPIPGDIASMRPGISASAFFGKRLGRRTA